MHSHLVFEEEAFDEEIQEAEKVQSPPSMEVEDNALGNLSPIVNRVVEMVENENTNAELEKIRLEIDDLRSQLHQNKEHIELQQEEIILHTAMISKRD